MELVDARYVTTEEEVCFVCLAGGDLEKCHCDCGIQAHPACLLKCVDRTGSLQCNVCKTPFRNVYMETRTTRCLSSTLSLVVANGVVSILTFVGAGILTTSDVEQFGSHAWARDVLLLMFGFMVAATLVTFAKLTAIFQSEGYKVWTETTVSRARFTTPASVDTDEVFV